MTHYISQSFIYTLKDIPLFCGLSDVQLDDLKSHTLLKHYAKESILFYEGDVSSCIHILFEGAVKMYKTTPSGKEIFLHYIEAPSVIAMVPSLQARAYPASCTLEKDGVVGMLPLNKFHMCLENIDCAVEIIGTMASRMKELEKRLHSETVFTAEAKVADFVIKNASLFERLKNTEIASILNLTPETLSRILSKLKKSNIITINQHEITVLDINALQDIIETNTLKDKKYVKSPQCCK